MSNNNNINELAFFTEDFFKNVYLQHKHETEEKLVPGTPMFFDCGMDAIEIPQEQSDEYYDFNRYIPIGVVLKQSQDGKTIMFISPFVIKKELEISDFLGHGGKNKALHTQLNSYISEYTKPLFKKKYNTDIKFFLPNDADFKELNNVDTRLILNGLDMLKGYCQLNNADVQTELLRGNVPVISEDKKKMMFYLGGIWGNFYANYLDVDYSEYYKQDNYSRMSYEEFMANSESPQIVYAEDDSEINQAKVAPKKHYDECNLIYDLDGLKKNFPNIQLMDISVIPFGVLKLT